MSQQETPEKRWEQTVCLTDSTNLILHLNKLQNYFLYADALKSAPNLSHPEANSKLK